MRKIDNAILSDIFRIGDLSIGLHLRDPRHQRERSLPLPDTGNRVGALPAALPTFPSG